MDKKETIAKIKGLYTSQEEKIKYLLQFCFVVIIYGFLISFVMNQIFSIPFVIKNIIAYGIVAYIIKAELPNIIASCFPKHPPQIIQ